MLWAMLTKAITRRLSAPAAALMVLTPNPVAASILGVSDRKRPAVLYRESDMPRPVIPGRSINADDYQHAPRPVAAMPKDYAPGEEIAPPGPRPAQQIGTASDRDTVCHYV